MRNPVYAERGDVNSCGDWLALALKDPFRTKDGGLDLTAFKACLKDNGLTAPKVDMDRHVLFVARESEDEIGQSVDSACAPV